MAASCIMCCVNWRLNARRFQSVMMQKAPGALPPALFAYNRIMLNEGASFLLWPGVLMSFQKTVTVSDPCMSDAICVAGQLGRLDFVSALLAGVALVVAVGGVVAFFNFRSLARRQAEDEARRIAAEIAEVAANKYIQGELPRLLEEYRALAANGGWGLHDDGYSEAQEDGVS